MKAATGFVAACLVTVFALPVENNAFAGFIEASANSQVIEAGVVDSCTAPNTLTGHAACSSGPATISFGTSTLQYAVSSEGIASFGSLRTFVSALVTAHVGNIGLSNNQVIARATVQFEDVLTLTHAPATGHVAFLIHSSGTEQTVVIGPNPVAAANSFAQTTLHSNLGGASAFLPNGDANFEFDYPFTSSLGVATFPFGFLMDATVRCLYFDQITCNSVADFLHTVNVTDLQVFDSQNHLVPGVFVVAESGHNYNSPAAALIPEPSSLPLFWTGLLVAMGLLRRGGSTAVAATSESAPALT